MPEIIRQPLRRPYPLWDVWHNGQRYAGGFFTKWGAKQWIADHPSDYLEEGYRKLAADPEYQAAEEARRYRFPLGVTRIDVVTNDSVYEFWSDKWEIHVQDDGRTIKLFQRGDGAAAKDTRHEELVKNFNTWAKTKSTKE